MALMLATMTVGLGAADTGVNAPLRAIVITNSGEKEAYVKRLDDPRRALVEVLCALLARRLGLAVPEPMLVFIPEGVGGPAYGFGSAAVGHPNVMTWMRNLDQGSVLSRLRRWKNLVQSACFDEWIANCDRHQGNLLFDGDDQFWLIDHDLALHESIPADALAPQNQLFEVAVMGMVEADLLTLRPKVLGVMESYAEHVAEDIAEELPEGVWAPELVGTLLAWLELRQNHLMRFGSERVPARQGDIFNVQ